MIKLEEPQIFMQLLAQSLQAKELYFMLKTALLITQTKNLHFTILNPMKGKLKAKAIRKWQVVKLMKMIKRMISSSTKRSSLCFPM